MKTAGKPTPEMLQRAQTSQKSALPQSDMRRIKAIVLGRALCPTRAKR
jgi:hypothetical protein